MSKNIQGYYLTTINNISELRESLSSARKAGKTIGFVPTMGALHEGHLSLVRASKEECDLTIVSIFVNPTQFGPTEDFSKYPRTMVEDTLLLETVGVDILFLPTPSEIYPENASTSVDVGEIGTIFEGEIRPAHFAGVSTVVASLFNITQPDIAYLGQKDLQQVAVLKKMTRDLHFPIKISVCSIIRDPDGLAMSSRNRYLSAEDRDESLLLSKTLNHVKVCIQSGIGLSDCILSGKKFFVEHSKTAKLDYLAIVSPETFQIPHSFNESKTVGVIIAAKVGTTRLIDNILVSDENSASKSIDITVINAS